MSHTDVIIERINHYLEVRDMQALKALLAELEEMEILHIIHQLPPEEEVIVFRLLSKDTALNIFEDLDTDQQQNLLATFSHARIIEYMNELPPDDRVKVLDEMPAMVAKRLINQLDPEERQSTNVLLGYAPETAGRLMTTEFISLRRDMTAKQALAKTRALADEKETIYTLYVTSPHKKLEGVLSLRGLLTADNDALLEDIMSQKVISVSTGTDQEEAARTLQDLDILALPVVDRENRLVGIITVDDAMDILEEEATEDMLDEAGIANVQTKEASRSETLLFGSLPQIWKLRLPFLIITMCTGLIAGTVIDTFEQSIAAVAALAVFIPVVMGMGGNVGTQSAITFTRGLLLGHIHMKDIMKRLLHEITVGASMGALIGIVVGLIAWIWFDMWQLGFVIGLSLISCTTIASVLGFMVPYLLVRNNLDQATGTGPLITSISDVTGLLVYFTMATIFMGAMLG